MIKHTYKRTFQYFLLAVGCLFFSFNAFADGYEIKLKATNVADTTMLLAYHHGHKIFIQDTAVVNKKGIAVFEGEEALPPGIYLGVYPGSNYFEFIVPREAEFQKFSIEVDTSDFVNSMKVKGSEENQVFNDYQKFLSKQSKKIQDLKEELKGVSKEDEDKQKEKQAVIRETEKAIFDYRKDLMAEKPDTYTAFLFRSMEEVTAPKAPELEDGEEADPYYSFYYIKNHFWDGFDFADDRIVRTPIFYNKIEKFLETYTPTHPDSINVAADIILKNPKIDHELFKYALGYITQKYQKSKIMGMEAVFVHLAANYFLKGQADWLEDKQIKKINERYQKLRYNLIGMKARNLKMENMEGEMVSLYDLEASYTLLLFWDYKCGNCKKRMPKIAEMYHKHKDNGFKVFAVCTQGDVKKWKDYVKGKDLPFTHVIDPKNTTNFRLFYDIYSTPTVYLLDEDKKIVAKRLGEAQFDSMLDRFYANKEKEESTEAKKGKDKKKGKEKATEK